MWDGYEVWGRSPLTFWQNISTQKKDNSSSWILLKIILKLYNYYTVYPKFFIRRKLEVSLGFL